MMLLIGLATGCASTSGERYTYQNLPVTMVAAKRENAQTIDLANLASTAVDSELIDRGDVIEVSIATGLGEKDSRAIPVRVHEDGMAKIPDVGPVPLAGLRLEAAEAAIVAACLDQQLYRNPHVTVTMRQQRVNRIMVTGAVKQPGTYEIPAGRCDLLAALTKAGGLSEQAGINVQIKNPVANGPGPMTPPRGDSGPPPIASNENGFSPVGHSLPVQIGAAQFNSVRVDLIAATKESGSNYLIEDGGVVHVEKRDPEPVHVIGLVQKPNRYEFPIGQDLRLTDVIGVAGGLSSPVADKIYVIRKKPNSSKTAIIECKLSEAKRNDQANVLLSPGDVVSVEQTPATIVLDAIRIINFGFGASLPLTAL